MSVGQSKAGAGNGATLNAGGEPFKDEVCKKDAQGSRSAGLLPDFDYSASL